MIGFKYLDFDTYTFMVQFRVQVSDSYVVIVEHYHYWIPKDPPLPSSLALCLLDIPMKLVSLDKVVPKSNLVDLTGADEDL